MKIKPQIDVKLFLDKNKAPFVAIDFPKHNSPVPEIEAVYFLFSKTELIYIGTSKRLGARIRSHKLRKSIATLVYVPFVPTQYWIGRGCFESDCIAMFCPKLNKTGKELPFTRISGTSKKDFDHKHINRRAS